MTALHYATLHNQYQEGARVLLPHNLERLLEALLTWAGIVDRDYREAKKHFSALQSWENDFEIQKDDPDVFTYCQPNNTPNQN